MDEVFVGNKGVFGGTDLKNGTSFWRGHGLSIYEILPISERGRV